MAEWIAEVSPSSEYRVPEDARTPINQKSVNAYLVRDGVWIDVHLSRVDSDDKDDALFDAIVYTASTLSLAALDRLRS